MTAITKPAFRVGLKPTRLGKVWSWILERIFKVFTGDRFELAEVLVDYILLQRIDVIFILAFYSGFGEDGGWNDESGDGATEWAGLAGLVHLRIGVGASG